MGRRSESLWLLLVAVVMLVMTLSAGPVFRIRRTVHAPFAEDGTRNEKVWSHADTVTGLVNPHTAGREAFSTWGQALYDRDNLYVSVRGAFEPAFRADRKVQRNLFSDNNFEFFLKREGSADDYQVVISESGMVFTGCNGGKPYVLPGLKTAVFSERSCWRAHLTIPLKAMGLKGEEQELRFNLCRQNIDLPQGKRQMSSFMVISGQPNYHVVSQWNKARMTEEPGSGRTLHAESDRIRINLLKDPGFDFMRNAFTDPDIRRMETAPLSGIWLIRATGKAYQFHGQYVEGLVEEGKDYTLRVRARRVGSEGAFGVLQLVRGGDGQYREGSRPGWNIPLSDEFQMYYLPFKGDRNTVSLVFYRMTSGDPKSCVDLENVSLFSGRISAFEIRQLSRPGMKNVVSGTTPERSRNAYGRMASPLKVLVLCQSLTAMADPLEIFSGLGIQADLLAVTANDTDVYYTESRPQSVVDSLKGGAYDLIMVGGLGVPQKIGKELAKQLREQVRKGAALFLNSPAPHGHLGGLVRDASVKALPESHPLKRGLPVEFLQAPAPAAGYSHRPLEAMCMGRFGRGRVLTATTSYRELPFQMIQDPPRNMGNPFPWSRFNKAWLARLMAHVTGRSDLSLSVDSLKGEDLHVSAPKLPAGTRICGKVWDKLGRLVANGEMPLDAGRCRLPLSGLKNVMNGASLITLHALNADGETLDYTAVTHHKSGPRIVGLTDLKLYHQGDDAAEVRVRVTGAAPGMELAWSLEDFAGRILERGRAQAGAQTTLTIPLSALYTNLGMARVRLTRHGAWLDAARIPLVAQDRDSRRVLDDFTPSIWNFGLDVTPELARQSHRQLEKIGFRSYLLPFHGLATLESGMTSGSMWRCAEIYHAQSGHGQTSSIRRPQFNTAASKRQIRKSVLARAKDERQIGTIQASLADEPGIDFFSNGNELDEHPENLAEYRKRMKAKYGTIAAYNGRMGTAYADFSDIRPGHVAEARKTGRYGEFMEWRAFNVDRWCEAVKLVADVSRAGDPNSRLSLTNTFGESPFNGNDYWKLLTKAGLDFSHEYTSMVYQGGNPIYEFDDFYRSFRPDLRVWGYTGYFYTREMAFFQPWWFAMHRYGGFTWFGAYTCVGSGGGGAWLNILDNSSGAFTQDAENVAESLRKSKLQQGLGKLFLDFPWKRNDVAIYYSHASMLLAFIRGKETHGAEIHATGPLHDMMYSRHRLGVALEEMLYQFEYLAPEQILAGKLKGRKVLFMPGVHALSAPEAAAIREFMAGGGRVIADFQPGDCDELGVKRKRPPFAGEKSLTVMGEVFDSKDMAQRKRLFRLLNAAGCRQLIGNEECVTLHGREAVHFQSGDMHVFGILRDQGRSRDHLTQTFIFPVRGHLYDIRAGKYLGRENRVTAEVPHGEASVWGISPYRIEGIDIQAPDAVAGLTDFRASFGIRAKGNLGRHVFHAELVDPSGESRFFMQRNLSAPAGKAFLSLRMAANDFRGEWRLRVTDVFSGVSAERTFVVR